MTPDEKQLELERLKKREKQIKAKIQGIVAKAAKQKRKDDTRIKILIGAAFLADLEKVKQHHPQAAEKQKAFLNALLNRAITNKKDRDFLTAQGFHLPEPSKPTDSDNQPNKKTETAKPETETNEKENSET